MDLTTILTFIGGLALFLFGMNIMGDALRSLTGGKARELIGKLCGTTLRGVLLGAAVTALVQSSSATTVMVIGFVNSGLMTLGESVGVIMGANLGTTVTSWLLALTGAGASGGILRLFNPSFFAPLTGLLGVIMIMRKKHDGKGNPGYALAGFTVLIFGMETMSGAVAPLSEMPEFTSVLTAISSPLPGFLAGALLTALIQSSSASVGILGALSASGAITVGGSIPVILGQNVGTCVTTLLSGTGASKNARRAAVIHLYFNLIGAAVQMVLFLILNAGEPPKIFSAPASVVSIAVVHTLFNLISLAIMLPFARWLERLAVLTVRDGNGTNDGKNAEVAKGGDGFPTTEIIPEDLEGYGLLDERFLAMPSFALTMCRAALWRMAQLCARGMSLMAEALTGDPGTHRAEREENVSLIDGYARGLTRYLTRLAGGRVRLRGEDVAVLTEQLSAVGELRRIGDLTGEAEKTVSQLSPRGKKASDPADAAAAENEMIEKTEESEKAREALAGLALDAERILREKYADGILSVQMRDSRWLFPELKQTEKAERVECVDPDVACRRIRQEIITRLTEGGIEPALAADMDTLNVIIGCIMK